MTRVAHDLTEAQRAFVDSPSSVYVEACPGAGKTRAIVARFVRRADEEPRRGIALLSFTNVAVDEVARRCAGSPRLLANPNFVGTFDSFINSFVVGPELASKSGRNPRFLESWDAQEVTNIAAPGLRTFQHFKLEWFEIFPAEKRAHLRLERLTSRSKALLEAYERNPEAVNARAWQVWIRRVKDRGYVSCSAARIVMGTYMGLPAVRDRIGRLISARFAEIVVDEAQDCGSEELALLRLAREYGVHICMVGDPDQSIFEFRDALPSEVRKFGGELGVGKRMAENFRSTPSICAVVRSLRSGTSADKAAGPHAGSTVPVFVHSYRNLPEVAMGLRRVAGLLEIEKDETIVLSHRASNAREAAGDLSLDSLGTKKTLVAARASLVLRDPLCTSRRRSGALDSLKRLLLDVVEGATISEESIEDGCGRLGISDRWIEASAYRLGLGLDPSGGDRTAYARQLRDLIDQLRWPEGIALKALGDHLKAPTESEWAACASASGSPAFRWATIHSVKGAEFPLVAVVLPKNLQKDDLGQTVIDRWDQGEECEARRVLYVGASRAKQGLVLAVHESHLHKVKAVLDRDGVPITTIDALFAASAQ